MKIELAKTEVIHFIGIGGIGMSGLSLIMKGKGFKVQGSDLSSNKNIDRLKKEKIKVFIGQKKQNLKNATIAVISSAIKKNNSEYIEARRKKLPIITRGRMLAHIVSLMKNIVVVGSHGKTTTTSLITSILQKTKLDPTIINGGVINSIKNTAKLGKSDWTVLEADESDGSFLHIPPTYSIITNIDREHMDFYKTIDDLKKYFIEWDNLLLEKNKIQLFYHWSAFTDINDKPASNPPWGRIVSMDINTGKIIWKKNIGKLNDNEDFNNMTGTLNYGGVALSSGGILFATGTSDNYVYALNSKNGQLLWEYKMNAAGSSPPILYEVDGNQYMSVISTGGAYNEYKDKDSVIYTFAIDEK